MSIRYIFFYALPEDIVPALKRFEENAPLKFVATDISPSPNRAIYLSSEEIPHPGIARQPSGHIYPTYMVSHRDIKNHLDQVNSKDGRTLWSLSNGANAETVLLDLGGLSSGGAVLEGSMTTLHDKPAAQQLMRWFLSALKSQNFVKVQGCWVGPTALGRLKTGTRLTQAEQSPVECDLKWSEVT